MRYIIFFIKLLLLSVNFNLFAEQVVALTHRELVVDPITTYSFVTGGMVTVEDPLKASKEVMRQFIPQEVIPLAVYDDLQAHRNQVRVFETFEKALDFSGIFYARSWLTDVYNILRERGYPPRRIANEILVFYPIYMTDKNIQAFLGDLKSSNKKHLTFIALQDLYFGRQQR